MNRVNRILIGIFVVLIITVIYRVTHPVFFYDLPEYRLTDTSEDIMELFHWYNAPVIIDTNTGNCYELHLWETKPEYPCEIDDTYTEYGHISLGGFGGVSIFSEPDINKVSVDISHSRTYRYSHDAARLHFNDKDLVLIEAIKPKCNFIIADLYKNNKKFFNITDVEKTLHIRHYTLELEEKDDSHYKIKMSSSYFEGGKDLDY